MLTNATINRLSEFTKPAVAAGLIPPEEHREALRTLREANRPGPSPKPKGKLESAKAVADRLDCCIETVRRMGRKGILPRVYLIPGNAKSLRFRSVDVDALCGVEG